MIIVSRLDKMIGTDSVWELSKKSRKLFTLYDLGRELEKLTD